MNAIGNSSRSQLEGVQNVFEIRELCLVRTCFLRTSCLKKVISGYVYLTWQANVWFRQEIQEFSFLFVIKNLILIHWVNDSILPPCFDCSNLMTFKNVFDWTLTTRNPILLIYFQQMILRHEWFVACAGYPLILIKRVPPLTVLNQKRIDFAFPDGTLPEYLWAALTRVGDLHSFSASWCSAYNHGCRWGPCHPSAAWFPTPVDSICMIIKGSLFVLSRDEKTQNFSFVIALWFHASQISNWNGTVCSPPAKKKEL